MSNNHSPGSGGQDENEGNIVSLCNQCGQFFPNAESVHEHIESTHGESKSANVAHSSNCSLIPDILNKINNNSILNTDPEVMVLSVFIAAALERLKNNQGIVNNIEESCQPEDLRINRSPVSDLSTESTSPEPLPTMAPYLASTTMNSQPILPPNAFIHHLSQSNPLSNLPLFLQSVGNISNTHDNRSNAPPSGHSSVSRSPPRGRRQTGSPAGKVHQCDTCKKTFTKSCNLNSHVKAVHKGVRAFKCDQCEKKFSRNSDLQKHVDAVHKGLRPYQCEICKKRFSQKSSLKRHKEAVHDGIKPYACNICEARFSYEVHLRRHSRAKHRIDITSNRINRNNHSSGSGNNTTSNSPSSAPFSNINIQKPIENFNENNNMPSSNQGDFPEAYMHHHH